MVEIAPNFTSFYYFSSPWSRLRNNLWEDVIPLLCVSYRGIAENFLLGGILNYIVLSSQQTKFYIFS